MMGYIKFLQRRGKITTRYKKLVYFSLLHKRSKAASFSASVRPLWGRLERVLQLSAGSIPFGHSTSGYWKLAPFGDRRLFAKLECFIKLLPLQGAGRNAMIPRAMPWATSFCPFRACGARRKGAAEIYTTPGAASILLLSIQLSAWFETKTYLLPTSYGLLPNL